MMSAVVQDEQEEEERKKIEEKKRILKVIAEELTMMVQEDPEIAGLSLRTISRLKRMTQGPQEEEEVLQTKVIAQQQVSAEWKDWIPAVQDEMRSLLEEKEALREVKKEELEVMYRRAFQEGRKIELIPSRLVCTVKPGERGGKKKIRWVACGNFEERRDQEENYSGGADATAFRVMVAMAQGFGRGGSVVDIKTAFLNAKMVQDQSEPLILIKPPHLLTEKKMLEKTSLFEPLRAIYGLRRSPKLWSQCRDEHLRSFGVKVVNPGGGEVQLVLSHLDSEPNLWRIHRLVEELDDDGGLYGLMMTYVDDLFNGGEDWVVQAVLSRLKETWKTSPPEEIGVTRTRFLGMDVRRVWNEDEKRFHWFVSQEGCIQEMLEEKEVQPRRLPVTRDQSVFDLESPEETLEEDIKKAQKAVGELLWLVARSRPDVMYAVARMSSSIARSPKGFLKSSCKERRPEVQWRRD